MALVLPALVQCAVMAQEPGQVEPQGSEEPGLVGFWQLCAISQSETGEPQMNLMPLLKIIGDDGSYTEVLIRTTGGGCSVVTDGKYEIKDDSTLVVTSVGMGGGPMGGGMPQRGEGGEMAEGAPQQGEGGEGAPQPGEGGAMPQGMPGPGQGGMEQSQEIKYLLAGEQWMLVEYTLQSVMMPGAETAAEPETVQEFWMRVGTNPRLKSVIKEALQGGSAAAVEESIDQDEQRMQERMQQRGQGGQRGQRGQSNRQINTSGNSMYNQTNSWMDED